MKIYIIFFVFIFTSCFKEKEVETYSPDNIDYCDRGLYPVDKVPECESLEKMRADWIKRQYDDCFVQDVYSGPKVDKQEDSDKKYVSLNCCYKFSCGSR